MTRRAARQLAKKFRYYSRKLGCCGTPTAAKIRRHGPETAESMFGNDVDAPYLSTGQMPWSLNK